MTRKCAWCNKQSDQLKEIAVLSTNLSAASRREIAYFVCPEHEAGLRRFYDRVRRYALLFMALICISLACLIGGALWRAAGGGYLFVASFASLGLVLFIFPFCTPETVEMIGVAKSILVARIIGGVIFAIGATVFTMACLI
jgi:hypothetical protein